MLHLDDALTLLDHANDVAAADVLGTLAVETPAHATVHVLLAQACERLHRWDQALAAWQTARLLVPDLAVVQQGTLRAAQVLAALQTLRTPSAAPETLPAAPPFAGTGAFADVPPVSDALSSVPLWPATETPDPLHPATALDDVWAGGASRPDASPEGVSAPAELYAAIAPDAVAPDAVAPDPYAVEAPTEPFAATSVVADPYAGLTGSPAGPEPAVEPPGAPASPVATESAAPAVPPPSAPAAAPGSLFSDPFATASHARRWDEPVDSDPPGGPGVGLPLPTPGALHASEAALPMPEFAPPPGFTARPALEQPPAAAPPAPAPPQPSVGEIGAWAQSDRLGEAIWSEPVTPVPLASPPPVGAMSPNDPQSANPLARTPPEDRSPVSPTPVDAGVVDPRLPGVPEGFDLDDLIESLSTAGRIVPRADLDAVPPPSGLDADDADEVVSPTLARIFAAQGQIADAIRAYERLAAAHPDRAADFLAEAAALRARPGTR